MALVSSNRQRAILKLSVLGASRFVVFVSKTTNRRKRRSMLVVIHVIRSAMHIFLSNRNHLCKSRKIKKLRKQQRKPTVAPQKSWTPSAIVYPAITPYADLRRVTSFALVAFTPGKHRVRSDAAELEKGCSQNLL